MNYFIRLCITVFFSVFLFNIVNAQVTKEYLDHHFFKCSKDSAEFYRLATYDMDSIYHGNIKTYFISGKQYSDIYYNHGVSEGTWTWWYENGQKSVEGFFDNGSYYAQNSWTPEGKPMVINGYGAETYLYWGSQKIRSKGVYKNGIEEGVWEWWYENGQLEERDEMLNGSEVSIAIMYDEEGKVFIKDGTGAFTKYFKKGKIKSTGQYKDGKREGSWTWYYPNGKVSEVCGYENGKLHGSRTQWFMNGKKRFEGSYKNGITEGKANWWHWNGKLKETGVYSEGDYTIENTWNENGEQKVIKGEGYSEYFYYTGILRSRGYYKEGKRVGRWTWYYKTGEIDEEGEYTDGKYSIKTCYTKDGKKMVTDGTGELINYYETGGVEVKGNYLNGKRNGNWIWKYENGNTKEVASYISDSLVGKHTQYAVNGAKEYERAVSGDTIYRYWWFEDGQVLQHEYDVKNRSYLVTYRDKKRVALVDKGNGRYESFHPNGKPKMRGNYVNFLKEGKWEVWHDNGVLKETMNYSAGFLEGTYKNYTDKDTLIFEGTFKNDKRHGQLRHWYDDGTPSMTLTYVNGVMNGPCIEYNKKGIIVFEGAIKNEKTEGFCKWYFEDGTLSYTGLFVEGVAEGIHIEYNEKGKAIKKKKYKNGQLK